MRYFIDTEFDGTGGPLLSIALVKETGPRSIYIVTDNVEIAVNSWVIENVISKINIVPDDTVVVTGIYENSVGHFIRECLKGDPHPIIIADSPVDIGRFCAAISTNIYGEYEPFEFARMTFEVYDDNVTDEDYENKHHAYFDALHLRQKILNE